MRTRSTRQQGGVSRHIDFVHASLLLPSSDESPAKPGALLEVRKLVQTIIDQTRAGDAECGYFLAELAVFLWKFREKFAVRNDVFHATFARLESSRPTTKKSSGLRPLIHQIIREACTRRRELLIARELRVLRFFSDPDNLLRLPEFGKSPEAVKAWTTKLVYPRLISKEFELSKHPGMRKIGKAWTKDRRFRVSRLKAQIEETVRRIALLPQSYYFHIA